MSLKEVRRTVTFREVIAGSTPAIVIRHHPYCDVNWESRVQ